MSDDDTQKRLAQIIEAFAAEWLQTQIPLVEEVMVELSRKLSEITNHREL